MLARKDVGSPEHGKRTVHNCLDFGELALSGVTAGKVAGSGVDDLTAPRSEGRNVLLSGGRRPHPHIHRGSHDNGGIRRKQRRAHQVIGKAMGHFGDDVGRGRGHENGIGLFGKRDMVNRVGGVVEQVDRNLLVRERSKGGGAHERSRVLSHADLDTHAGLLEETDDLT